MRVSPWQWFRGQPLPQLSCCLPYPHRWDEILYRVSIHPSEVEEDVTYLPSFWGAKAHRDHLRREWVVAYGLEEEAEGLLWTPDFGVPPVKKVAKSRYVWGNPHMDSKGRDVVGFHDSPWSTREVVCPFRVNHDLERIDFSVVVGFGHHRPGSVYRPPLVGVRGG